MPVWHEAAKALRASGKLKVIGITQEQHPDRCSLFAAWQGLDWPILWDPFNMTGTTVVPRATLIDEHGVVRALRASPATLAAEFMAKTFPAPLPTSAELPAVRGRLIEAELATAGTPEGRWYDALSAMLWPANTDGEQALHDLAAFAKARPDDAAAQWRLGVAYRMRYDTGERQEGDFQLALDQWMKGLALNPRQYIYRRRIQQYGPRLDKPYPFYGWIAEAQKALGKAAPPLSAPLSGAELATKGRPTAAAGEKEPDPDGAIEAGKGLLEIESAVAWHTSPRRGDAARVHVQLRPAGSRVLLWDAEAGPVTLWLDLPEGWTTEARRLEQRLAGTDKAGEEVALDFEIGFPDGKAAAGVIRGYALYYACLDGPGECRYLRENFTIRVPTRR